MKQLPWFVAATCGLAACAPAPLAPPMAPGATGYKLLAVAGATASASSSLSGFAPARALDGDHNTEWSNATWREASAWWLMDLGSDRALSTITLKLRPLTGAARCQIEVSADGTSYSPAGPAFAQTSWNLETRTLPAGTHGRYVRLRFSNDPAAPMDRFAVFEVQLGASTPAPSPTPVGTPTPAPSGTPLPPPSGGGSLAALVRLSVPGRAVATSGSPTGAVDGNPASMWVPSTVPPQSISVPLASPASGSMLVRWHSAGYQYTNTGYAPRTYLIQTSIDSTDGRNGTWLTAQAVSDNPLRSRIDTIQAPGARWVRLQVQSRWNVGPSIREFEVYATGGGRQNAWLILGDSITAQAFDPAKPDRFSDQVASRTGARPLVVGGGTGGDTVALATPRLAAGLPTLPAGSFVGISLGANDATTGVPVATFKAGLQDMINRIKASGRTPVIARTGWTLNPRIAEYVQAIDGLAAANGLPPGPDFYSYFKAHPEELNSDRVHPTATGEQSIQRLWAEAAARAISR